MPSLIRAIEADLDSGRSAVVQLVSTGEALMERRIAEIPASEWDDINIDLTPRETVIEFLARLCQVNRINSEISVNVKGCSKQFQWLSLVEKCRKQPTIS